MGMGKCRRRSGEKELTDNADRRDKGKKEEK
jgi:hypothetical protein